MKKIFFLSITCLLLFATILSFQVKPMIAKAEENLNETTTQIEIYDEDFSICVSGEANKQVSPDIAQIVASIETLDMDISKSKDQNFEIFQKIINALKELGLSDDDIQYDSFSCYPNYDYSSGKTLTGHHSTTIFTVTTDVENVKNTVDCIIENGATSIRNINYQVSNLDEIYNEVLADALSNARTKAEALTGKTDLQICDIKEEITYYSTSLYKTYSDTLQNSSMIGKLDIRAKVMVEFN